MRLMLTRIAVQNILCALPKMMNMYESSAVVMQHTIPLIGIVAEYDPTLVTEQLIFHAVKATQRFIKKELIMMNMLIGVLGNMGICFWAHFS